MDIIKGNKLIAEFMDFTFTAKYPDACTPHKDFLPTKPAYEGYGFDQLEFHSSWDWLIPAYRKYVKIWKLHNSNSKLPRIPYNISYDLNEHFMWITLKGVYSNLVKFIEWYNKQTKK